MAFCLCCRQVIESVCMAARIVMRHPESKVSSKTFVNRRYFFQKQAKKDIRMIDSLVTQSTFDYFCYYF